MSACCWLAFFQCSDQSWPILFRKWVPLASLLYFCTLTHSWPLPLPSLGSQYPSLNCFLFMPWPVLTPDPSRKWVSLVGSFSFNVLTSLGLCPPQFVSAPCWPTFFLYLNQSQPWLFREWVPLNGSLSFCVLSNPDLWPLRKSVALASSLCVYILTCPNLWPLQEVSAPLLGFFLSVSWAVLTSDISSL